jgi:hypothetical protein
VQTYPTLAQRPSYAEQGNNFLRENIRERRHSLRD